MKHLVLIAFLLSGHSYAETVDDLNALNRARKVRYDATFTEVKNLNYIRMKILGIKSGTTRLTDAWKTVEPTCTPTAPVTALENCHAQLLTASQDAEMQLSQLEALTKSENYERLIRTPANGEIQLQRLVQDTVENLTGFVRQSKNLKRVLGQRLAAIEFKRTVESVEVDAQQARQRVQCRILPTQLGQKLNVARLSRTQGEAEADPYLIIRAQGMAEEVEESAQALVAQCAAGNFAGIRSEVSSFLASQPKPEAVRAMALRACGKVQNKDPQLRSVCESAYFNPAIYFSIHQALRKPDERP